MRTLIIVGAIAAVGYSAIAFPQTLAADVVQCNGSGRVSPTSTGERPVRLLVRRNTPCRLTRASTLLFPNYGAQMGFEVLENPRNGQVHVESGRSFIFTPSPDFVGTDTMLVRFLWENVGGPGYGVARFTVIVE
jgi:hypothetical protein